MRRIRIRSCRKDFRNAKKESKEEILPEASFQ
jgi:hypothetical protein